MSIPNLIPHKTLYISGYIYSYYAFVFIFEFPEHISKHILQFHTFLKTNVCFNVLMNKQKNHVLIMMVPHVQTAIVHHFYIATHAQVVQYPNCFIHQPPN